MRETSEVDGDWNYDIETWCQILVYEQSSWCQMQLREYKKDFDASRRNLYRAEENYALEKNK